METIRTIKNKKMPAGILIFESILFLSVLYMIYLSTSLATSIYVIPIIINIIIMALLYKPKFAYWDSIRTDVGLIMCLLINGILIILFGYIVSISNFTNILFGIFTLFINLVFIFYFYFNKKVREAFA